MRKGGISTKTIAAVACHGIVLCFLLIHHSLPAQKAGEVSIEMFQKLVTDAVEEDTAVVNPRVRTLLTSLQEQRSPLHDSLTIAVINWHYTWLFGTLPSETRLAYLNTYRPTIERIQSADHAGVARFYGHYVPAHRMAYQGDSIPVYLDLMEEQIKACSGPVEIALQWYFEKGRYAHSQGDYEVPFFQRGLEFVNTYFPDQLRYKNIFLNAIGIEYRRTNQIDQAIAFYEQALRDGEKELRSTRMLGAVLNNLGLAYKDKHDYPQAIRRISAAIAYYMEHFDPTYEDIGSGFDNIALCYREQGKLDSSLIYSQKAMAHMRKHMGDDYPDLLLPMSTMTETYEELGNLEAALKINNEAQAFLKSLGWSEEDPGGDYYLADAFSVFGEAERIAWQLYEKTSDRSHLLRAIAAGKQFMITTDYAYDNLQNDLSREVFQLKHSDVYSACVRDLYTLFTLTGDHSALEQAFSYTERFKSLELLYAAQKDKANTIPRYADLNHAYRTLTDSIKHYERTYHAVADDSVAQVIARSALNKHKEALYLWKERTRQFSPDYYQLIYHPETVTIARLQEALKGTDQTILSYHVSDSAVYVFVVTEDHSDFVQVKTRTDLSTLISMFRKSIYGFYTDSVRSEQVYIEQAQLFAESGHALYQILIEPIHSSLTKRVVIIVDKVLGYVPFDLLLTKLPQVPHHFRDLPYFLRAHAVSYSYSARLWMDMRSEAFGRTHQNENVSLLALAPDFPAPVKGTISFAQIRSGLTKLYFNTSEARSVLSVFPGTILTGIDATKSRFITVCPQFNILHLATHSKANDEQGDFSFLAFTDTGEEDNRLFASEIYDLDLSAELVTLSACETGLGELKSGEGIISLARAFSFAGARSIVSSLWSVNDRSTPDLMESFYRQLKSGAPKDVALQTAKLNFISSLGHADAHPFFWGGFICVGDPRAMPKSFTPLWIWYLLMPLCMIALSALAYFQPFSKK